MKPFVVTLLAGICGGKSTIASKFAKLGAKIVDADKIGHAQLANPTLIQRISQEWGSMVLDSQGQVDRKKLGPVVFADPSQLKKLEAMISPLILTEIKNQLLQYETTDETTKVVILDAPLAGETGLLATADLIIFIDVDLEVRRQRAEQIRHWNPGELERREKLQMPLEEKRKLAHHVIKNNSNDEADQDIQKIWEAVVASLKLKRKMALGG